ncbi:helix-turn-helix transcriptional regulator [Stappia sp. ES.058]|uniref:helix-turn-helix domain-containing protein n=1 Tax=Stappia sp. ES.058 TaxID=1881061 RepID=UPI0008792D12|nr:helix-turn-helix transcriptional regulator [Stappia sp. ES.058]SDU28226.1 Helix-turn-helix [Stappia sp. ES.058]
MKTTTGSDDDFETMTPERFRLWRKALGLKQKDAADRLGLKKRMIQYYEKGDRDGRPVEIPKSVRLACFAISSGIDDFNGTGTVVAGAPGQPAPADREPETAGHD